MQILSFGVYGQRPQPKGSMRAFLPKGRNVPIVTSSNKALKPWEQQVRQEARAAVQAQYWMVPGPDMPLRVSLTFWMPAVKKKRSYPTVKPDLDKLIRGTLDGLTHVVFKDDAQIVTVIAQKRYTTGEPGCDVSIQVD